MMKITRGAVAEPQTSLAYLTGSWRVEKPIHVLQNAPCHGACPAGEDPKAYLAFVDQGKMEKAWQVLVSANPMPAITGRVCPHPCEQACNRQHYDSPLAIHAIERVLGDLAIANQWSYDLSPLSDDAPKVAVVGAGPAGLSCAYHLRRLGVAPVLFEAEDVPGGLLSTAIPPYRLPRDVLKDELRRVLALDIDFRPLQRLGRDFTLDELCKDYAAVFLGLGLGRSGDWSVQGATPADLHDALSLLREWHRIGKVPVARRVAIIGGGNTAIDLARILKFSGCETVHVITHYAIPGEGEDPMQAFAREVHQAIEEGVIIHPHRGVSRLVFHGDDLKGIEMVHMRRIMTEHGSARMPFEGTESILEVDMVIPAVGETIDPTGLESLVGAHGKVKADFWGKVDQMPVWVGGDLHPQSVGYVSEAIGFGARSAQSIAAFLGRLEAPQKPSTQSIAYEHLNTHYFEPAKRIEINLLPPDERRPDREIEQGITPEAASKEAKRCFCCGDCLDCNNCWTLCPDEAVLYKDHADYVFDYDYCKGCGICAAECPTGYIKMTEE
jgi:NADPH-dependent glutamate synthase beta subunit-like oxidoreductase